MLPSIVTCGFHVRYAAKSAVPTLYSMLAVERLMPQSAEVPLFPIASNCCCANSPRYSDSSIGCFDWLLVHLTWLKS